MEMTMRDYVLTQSQSRQAYGMLTVVARLVRNWKHHRDLEKLLKLDDYLLRDMGLTRGVVLNLFTLLTNTYLTIQRLNSSLLSSTP